MIPRTYPSYDNTNSGRREMVVYYLSSVTGLTRWVDYIPVKHTADFSVEQTTDNNGYTAVRALSSTTGYTSWVDYVPVYADAAATDAWVVSTVGYIPVGVSGAMGGTLYLNFTRPYSTLQALDPRITFSRLSTGNSAGTYFGSDGLLKEAKVNLITRSGGETAVPGSPGTAPTGASIVLGLSNGVTRSISGSGVTDGVGWFELTLSGTFTASENVSFFTPAPGTTTIAASVGQVYTASCWWGVVSGTLPAPSSSGLNGVRLRYGNPGFLSQAGASDTPRTTWGRQTVTATAPASTSVVGTDILWSFNAGQSVSFTVRMGGFQLETGSTASQYIATTSAASAAPRIDYDPVTLECKGLLIEEQRTNYCLQSQDLSAAAWNTKTNISVSTNSVAAPDGTTTADTLTATAGNAVITQGIATTAVPWTFSIFLKRKTGTGNVDITMDGTTWVTQSINSTTWTRVNVTQTGVAGTSNCGIRIVSNGDEVYAWGGQAE